MEQNQMMRSSQMYSATSSRAVTLKGVWDSKEPSFVKIRNEHGLEVCKMVLLLEIKKMIEILKADLQETHVKFFIDYILENYNSYTISDIITLTHILVRKKPYGKPILQDLIYELDEYSTVKQNFIEQERAKENSRFKEDVSLTNEKILKEYQAMKDAPPPTPQKEKDRINKLELEQKQVELRRQYNF